MTFEWWKSIDFISNVSKRLNNFRDNVIIIYRIVAKGNEIVPPTKNLSHIYPT